MAEMFQEVHCMFVCVCWGERERVLLWLSMCLRKHCVCVCVGDRARRGGSAMAEYVFEGVVCEREKVREREGERERGFCYG